MNSPAPEYSDYRLESEQSQRCCQNCKHYTPVDHYKGMCYEFEVLPYAGCKYYVEKEE